MPMAVSRLAQFIVRVHTHISDRVIEGGGYSRGRSRRRTSCHVSSLLLFLLLLLPPVLCVGDSGSRSSEHDETFGPSAHSPCETPRVALCITGEARTLPLVVENIRYTHIDAVGSSCVDTFAVIDITSAPQKTTGRPSTYRQVRRAIDVLAPVSKDVQPVNETGAPVHAADVGFSCGKGIHMVESRPYRKNGRYQFEKNYRCWRLVQEHEAKQVQDGGRGGECLYSAEHGRC